MESPTGIVTLAVAVHWLLSAGIVHVSAVAVGVLPAMRSIVTE